MVWARKDSPSGKDHTSGRVSKEKATSEAGRGVWHPEGEARSLGRAQMISSLKSTEKKVTKDCTSLLTDVSTDACKAQSQVSLDGLWWVS